MNDLTSIPTTHIVEHKKRIEEQRRIKEFEERERKAQDYIDQVPSKLAKFFNKSK